MAKKTAGSVIRRTHNKKVTSIGNSVRSKPSKKKSSSNKKKYKGQGK